MVYRHILHALCNVYYIATFTLYMHDVGFETTLSFAPSSSNYNIIHTTVLCSLYA